MGLMSTVLRTVSHSVFLLPAQVHRPISAWASTRSDLPILPDGAIRYLDQQVFLDLTWRLFSAALPRTAPQRSQQFSLQIALPRYGFQYLYCCGTARRLVIAALPAISRYFAGIYSSHFGEAKDAFTACQYAYDGLYPRVACCCRSY